MITPSRLLTRIPGTALMTLVGLLALPLNAQAKGPKGFKSAHGQESKARNDHQNDEHDQNDRNARDRQAYASRPRSGFSLTFGTGYAGRGYYYGPPNSAYYYERPEVRYYATREAAPREYFRNESYQGGQVNSSVQRELSRRGYYRGYVDGQIGPQSRRAIATYQQDHGLRPTGYIDSSLLNSLGIR